MAVGAVFLLFWAITWQFASGDICSFAVQNGCVCDTEESHTSISCKATNISGTSPLIVSNLTEKVALQYLDLSGNYLQELSVTFFTSIQYISKLVLNGNQFISNPLLETVFTNVSILDLSNNKFSEFDSEDFAHLPVLETLDLSSNQIHQTVVYENNTLHLTSLNLSHNSLPTVSTELWKLSLVLHLNGNKLTSLPPFPECNLKHLFLQKNKITDISENTFLKMTHLEELYLDNNQLTEIDEKTFAGAMSLTHLSLINNNIHRVEVGTFKSLPNIVAVDLSRNNVAKIKNGAFGGLEESISRLSLKGNELSYIHPEAFGKLENMRYLDLSDNPALADVSSISFPPHIIFLDLSNCSLKVIQDCKFAAYMDLQILGLAHNNLACSCHLSWLHNWQKYIRTNIYISNRDSIPNWWCFNSHNKLVKVNYDPSKCNLTKHLEHCQIEKSAFINPDTISLNISVKAEDEVITAKWSMKSESSIHGFIVTYNTKDNTKFESPLLKSTVNQYVIKDMKVVGSYTVCVHALLNETYTIKQACQVENSNLVQMIVGILAGIVFLIPCVTALVYILYKDYRVMKAHYLYLNEQESTEDDKKQPVKEDNIKVTEIPVIQIHGHEVVPMHQMDVHEKNTTRTEVKNVKTDSSHSNPAFESDCDHTSRNEDDNQSTHEQCHTDKDNFHTKL